MVLSCCTSAAWCLTERETRQAVCLGHTAITLSSPAAILSGSRHAVTPDKQYSSDHAAILKNIVHVVQVVFMKTRGVG